MTDPWSQFLTARANMIDAFHSDGKTDEDIAELLSMDSARQVSLIRKRDRHHDCHDETPLSGRWHHGNGNICAGTLRIAREDFDTNPSDERKKEILDWMCETLTAAQERIQA